MPVQQIAPTLSNGSGDFADLLDFLEENGIHVVGVTPANTGERGRVRFVVTDEA